MFYGCLGAGEVPFLPPCTILFRKKKNWTIYICEFKFFWPEAQQFVGLDFFSGKKKKKKACLENKARVTKICLFLFKSLSREIVSCLLLRERFKSKANSTYSKIYRQLFESKAKQNFKRDLLLDAAVFS